MRLIRLGRLRAQATSEQDRGSSGIGSAHCPWRKPPASRGACVASHTSHPGPGGAPPPGTELAQTKTPEALSGLTRRCPINAQTPGKQLVERTGKSRARAGFSLHVSHALQCFRGLRSRVRISAPRLDESPAEAGLFRFIDGAALAVETSGLPDASKATASPSNVPDETSSRVRNRGD